MIDRITALIASKDLVALKHALSDSNALELAQLVNELDEVETAIVFRVLPHDVATETFEYLESNAQRRLLNALRRDEVIDLLDDMSPDDRTAFLEELPPQVTKELLALLPESERKIAETLLNYPKYSVGRLMTPDYVAVKPGWTVLEVLDYIRENGKDSETLNVIYVTDKRERLIDDIKIREFLLAPLEKKVSDLMDSKYLYLLAEENQEAAVTKFRSNDRVALPVTNAQGYLLGIVTLDDILVVAEEETTEDIQKFGGLESLDLPYDQTPLRIMITKRAGWLVILFLSEMLTATAMSYYEAEIAKAVVLALFVPLIISSGGNSGSQAATLIIRALALGEVALTDWWRIMRKEILSGIVLGLILGTIGFLRIFIWSYFSDLYGPHWLLIGLTVGFSLVGVVLWGTLSGSMMPMLLKRLGFDPATSSAPFVATLVDVTGLVIYFSVAELILRGNLL